MGSTTRVRSVMSLGDVAELARVARPVVSTWRRRVRLGGADRHFPPAVSTDRGVELFDADDVVRWLTTSDRGNNPDVALDVLAHALPAALMAGGRATSDSLDRIEALIALKTVSGAVLTDLDDDALLDLADECDPDDEFLFTEVEALGSRRAEIADYAEGLVEAAYGPAPALDRLAARRRTSVTERSVQLRPEALRVVAEIAAALVLDLGDGVAVGDLTGGADDLVGALMSRLGDGSDVAVWMRSRSAATRRALRRAQAEGWPRARSWGAGAPGLVLAHFPNSVTPRLTAAALLDQVDNLQLDLDDAQRAIVVGPADILCDTLTDPHLEAARSLLVRLGRLRAAIRLPRGLVVGSPRHALGIWVLGPERTQISLADRWIATADLRDQDLTGSALLDLAVDVVAAMGDRALGHAHAFSHARVTRTADLLAAGGPVVPTGVRPARLRVVVPGAVLAELALLTDAIDTAPVTAAVIGPLIPEPSSRPAGMPATTLADAVTAGTVRVIKGVRLDPDLIAPDGPARVLTPADLDPEKPTQRLGADPLEVEERHPQARRTEPGDVVFRTAPTPAAVVDREGFSFVAYPARVLRCRAGSGLVPEAVSAAVNARSAAAHDWQSWPVPTVDPADADTLARALRGIADERRTAQQRIARLDHLTSRLIDAVATRAVTLTDPAAVDSAELVAADRHSSDPDPTPTEGH